MTTCCVFRFPFGLKKTVVSWLSRVTCISPWDSPFLLIVVGVSALFSVHVRLLYTCFEAIFQNSSCPTGKL